MNTKHDMFNQFVNNVGVQKKIQGKNEQNQQQVNPAAASSSAVQPVQPEIQLPPELQVTFSNQTKLQQKFKIRIE